MSTASALSVRAQLQRTVAERVARRKLPNPLLIIALVGTLVYHGALELSGSYQRTYDAYVHIFFADHYRRGWFSSWDPRWYTGFTTVSYPPGTHQLVALLSNLVGLRTGFVVVQIIALLVMVVGVYRFSLLWVDKQAAGWAAILLVVSSSIAETVHVFGQLPTTFSLSFLLNSLPFAYRWVKEGHVRSFVCGVLCAAATTAGHHVTTLFGSVFFLGPVLVLALLDKFRTPLPGEKQGRAVAVDRTNVWPLVARRLRRIIAPVLRAGAYGISVIVGLVLVVLPYWLWSSSDPITQVPIPHASRDSFIVNLNAGLVFWLVPWGVMLLVFPYAIGRMLPSRAWPLVSSLLLLALLGTGGTTPIPRMLLGNAFNILTLDRFTFWGTIVILPMAGKLASSIAGGNAFHWLTANVGRRTAKILGASLGVMTLLMSLFSANLTHYRPFQPQKIDPGPIVRFMEKDEHWRWRYIMLGFGDQMAWVSAQMTANTIDGNYHSARRLPELTSTPVERLEGAKYTGVPGLGSLQQLLTVPERYHLKFALSNDKFYDPLLAAGGWTPLGILENGIYVWERADITPIPPALVNHQIPLWERLMWGILPPSAIFLGWTAMIWAALGYRLPRWVFRVHRRANRLLRPFLRPYRWFDHRLETAASRVSDEGYVARSWHFLRTVEHVKKLIADRPSRRRQRLQQAALALALLLVAGGIYVVTRPPAGPDAMAIDYYLALDLREFTVAWNLLDPTTRPEFETYRKDLLADGGLVASYAKLNTARAKVRSLQGNRALVSVSLDYLTAINPYHVDEDVEAVKTKDGWHLRTPYIDKTQPPEKFTSRTSVDYLTSRRSSASRRDGRDILDRPRMRIANSKAMQVDGRWVVVGEVTDVDVDPADVTVTAQLRGTDGELLAGYNASFVMVHKLLPGETASFRVDFEGVIGKGGGNEPSLEFNPLAVTPLVLPPGTNVGSVDVYVKAVVTDVPIDRSLGITNLRVETSADGKHELVGTVRNDGVGIVAIPHLILTFRDKDGNAAWVDHAYLSSSISPQHTLDFRVPMDQHLLQPTSAPVNNWDGAQITAAKLPVPPPPLLPLPADTGFTSLDIVAVALL